MIALLHSGHASVLQTTPSWLRVLAGTRRSRRLPRMKLLAGGEELPRDLAETLLAQSTELWNLYGPTEATIWSTCSRVRSGAGPVPIGTPIANARIYLLDERGQPVQPGVRGEIWIAGAGVASGYLRQPELTAERFRPDPFVHGERMYRSGDIGSWQAGELQFHGRDDDQFKFHGFRIEPAEIEAAALAEPGVEAAVAALVASRDGESRIVLYVVATASDPAFARELHERLRGRLPAAFVPRHIELLQSLPQTAHGKIDRKALPEPKASPRAVVGQTVAPDSLAQALLAIWRELLDVEDVALDSNFFDVGGDSFLGVELFQRAHRLTGISLPLSTLLTAQTVREQTRVFRAAGARDLMHRAMPSLAAIAERWSPLVPIQTTGTRPPLFCVHAIGGNVLNYVPLARALGEDQPVFGLQAVGLDGVSRPLASIQEMAAHYLPEIRAQVPHGPYYLCGGSMGGLIAFELAQLLSAAHEQVAFLGLFDTYRPDDAWRGSSRLSFLRWRERWVRARQIGAKPHGSDLITQAIQHRVYRGCDAVRSRWHRWRGSALPPAARYRELERIHARADFAYRPLPYGGQVTLFRAHEQPAAFAGAYALGWENVDLGGLHVVDLPGSHARLIEQPMLASALREALELAESRAAESTQPRQALALRQ